MPKDQMRIYTDGACEPNPGPGGYGVVLISGDTVREFSQGYALTTNNRMELTAVIAALEAVRDPSPITLYSDSKYVVDAMNQGWARSWKERGWVRKGARKVPNADLWMKLLNLDDRYEVTYEWVKGHAGNQFNERADALSYQAIHSSDQLQDHGYLTELEEQESFTEITEEGQPCRKCSTPVIKRKPRSKRRSGQKYYYEYYLFCPQCETMYMVKDAKRQSNQGSLL